jgi:CO dehydrogenase/acetyl-CoA synthase gamma subunit (corrinoid Fe-S protein)
MDVNGPEHGSPILVSGNHVHTQDILTSILSTTRSPFFLLFTDTKGNTVDMAVIFKTMTAGRIRKELETSGVFDRTPHQDIILPGLARAVGAELMQSTRWEVIVGPICAAELPLFLADIWLPPRK